MGKESCLLSKAFSHMVLQNIQGLNRDCLTVVTHGVCDALVVRAASYLSDHHFLGHHKQTRMHTHTHRFCPLGNIATV